MQNTDEVMIKEGKLTDVIRLYNSITDEFPENERKSIEVFIRLFETGQYNLLIAYNETGFEVGYAFLYTIRELNMLWLDFIVIHPRFQGKGYGTKFFDKINCFYGSFDGMFLEVEIPHGTHENQSRRVLFYERAGAERLDLRYYLPNEFGELEMYLYFKSFNNLRPEPTMVIKVIESAYEFIHSDIANKELLLNQTVNSQDGKR